MARDECPPHSSRVGVFVDVIRDSLRRLRQSGLIGYPLLVPPHCRTSVAARWVLPRTSALVLVNSIADGDSI